MGNSLNSVQAGYQQSSTGDLMLAVPIGAQVPSLFKWEDSTGVIPTKLLGVTK